VNLEQQLAEEDRVYALAVSIRWVALHLSWDTAMRILRELERLLDSENLIHSQRLVLLEKWHSEIWLEISSEERKQKLALEAAMKGILGPP
jgi:hypothetical protein